MEKQHKLLKKVSLGIASLALIAPLALSSVSNVTANANASSNPQTETMNSDESRSSFLKHSYGSKHQENLMKHAKSIFVQKGHRIYTAKANGTNMFPSTMRYYSSLSKFKKIATHEIKRLKKNKKKYNKTHKHSLKKHMAHEMTFTELAQLPASYRIPAKTKRARHSYSFKIKNNKGQIETLLKSEFKRGTKHQAKKAGFAYGPHENNAITIFSKYKPNSKKAIVPKHFKVRPDQTVWLVGHHTNSFYKIDRFHQAYYYNGQAKGWADIGL